MPVPLRDCLGAWQEIREGLSHASRIMILSDFDGTLSPLVDIPSAATIDPDVTMVLRRLCMHDSVNIAVLSGRAVSDVAQRIGLPVIIAGEHGLEIHGRDFEFAAPGAERYRQHAPAMCESLRRSTKCFAGSLVEPKHFGASVHFRHVHATEVAVLEQVLRAQIDDALYEIRNGKYVWEVRPRLKWDKGAAAHWILRRCRIPEQAVICLGDDTTDADMFRSLTRAVNIQVGFDGCDLGAKYWIPQAEVAQFLAAVLRFVVETERVNIAHAQYAVGAK